MNLAKLTLTEMKLLVCKKEATATEIFDALIAQMRERKTKTSAKKVMQFCRVFSLAWQHISDEDLALFQQIQTSN
tara:strand:+ start:1829 stop:2053 length:225 start_codon:yes stop_codon:yes gene_type:complete